MRGLFVFSFCVFIVSCRPTVPKNILPPAKMKLVLWDVMQVDELAEYNPDSSLRNLSKHVDYYQKVFAIHKISKEDFKRSLVYYENHPASFKTILDSLQSYGERLQHADSLKRFSPPHQMDSALKKRAGIHIRP